MTGFATGAMGYSPMMLYLTMHSFCMQTYDIYCQSQEVDESLNVFMCDNCSIDDSSDGSDE